WHFDSTGVADLGYNIIRDSTMARNLSWTLTTGYPTSKIIVWMHSEHIETNPADIRDQNGSTPFHGWATTGALTRAALGSQLYSIGCLAGSGSWQTSELGAPAPSTISLPPSGSWDDLFLQAGKPLAFLDLRHPSAGGEWISAPRVARPFFYTLTS